MALQEVVSAYERSILTASSDFWSLDGNFSDEFLNTWYCDWNYDKNDLQCLICVSDQEEEGWGSGTSSKPRTLVCTRHISYRDFLVHEVEPVVTEDDHFYKVFTKDGDRVYTEYIYDTIEVTIYYQSGSSYAGTRSLQEANISEFSVRRRTDNSEARCVAVNLSDGTYDEDDVTGERKEVYPCDLCRDDVGAWATGLRKIARKGGTLSDYDVAVDRPEDGYWQPSLSGVPKTCPPRPEDVFLGGIHVPTARPTNTPTVRTKTAKSAKPAHHRDFANQYKMATVVALLLTSLVFVVAWVSFQRRHRCQRVPEKDPEHASDTELVLQASTGAIQ